MGFGVVAVVTRTEVEFIGRTLNSCAKRKELVWVIRPEMTTNSKEDASRGSRCDAGKTARKGAGGGGLERRGE